MNNFEPIGILGGTFDPVHLGHLHIAREVRKQAELQKVIFIPCSQSPTRSQPLANSKQRLAMLEKAIAGSEDLAVSDLEIQRDGLSYTVDTLRTLNASPGYANNSFGLIMGTDTFSNFITSWHQWEQILELAHLLIADRNEIATILENNSALASLVKERQIFDPHHLREQKSGKIMLLSIHPLSISATKIRSLIKVKNYVEAKKLLPMPVLDYILANNLYQIS